MITTLALTLALSAPAPASALAPIFGPEAPSPVTPAAAVQDDEEKPDKRDPPSLGMVPKVWLGRRGNSQYTPKPNTITGKAMERAGRTLLLSKRDQGRETTRALWNR